MKFIQAAQVLHKDLHRFEHTVDGYLQKTMDDNVQYGQKSQAGIPKVHGQRSMRHRFIWCEFLTVFLMKSQVLFVPVDNSLSKFIPNILSKVIQCFSPIVLPPVIGRVVLGKLLNSVAEFMRLQQQQLNDVETNLTFAAFVIPQGLEMIKCQIVQLFS